MPASRTPTPDDAGGDVALIISAMFRLASDPQDWDPLISALGSVESLETAPLAAEVALSHARELAEARAELASLRPPTGPAAWLMFSFRGRLLSASDEGRARLARGLGEIASDGGVRFANPEDQLLLDERLAGLAAGETAPRVLRFEGASGAGPTFAFLSAAAGAPGLPGLEARPDLSGAGVLVFAPSDGSSEAWGHLRESFSLTPAELRLAQRLGEGLSLNEAAMALGVSSSTVRNQLRSIFEKVGVHRQSELVRLLSDLSSMAAVFASGLPSPHPVPDSPPLQNLRLRDRRRLSFREYGTPQGRPFLIFHEGLGSSLLPAGVDGAAARLGLRLICADRPGFGQSDPLPAYSFEGVAEDLATLCDHLGIRRVDVVTMISGAPAGLRTAVTLGDRVGNLVLVSGRPPISAARSRAPDLVNRLRARIEGHPWVLDSLFGLLRAHLSRGLVLSFMRRSAEGSASDLAYIQSHPQAADYIQAYIKEALSRSTRGPADELLAFRRGQNMTLEGLKARLCIWHGEEDRFAPLDPLLQFVGDRVDEVRIFPGVGHFLSLREWPAILRALAELPRDDDPA